MTGAGADQGSVLDRVADVALACRACGATREVPGRWDPPAMASWASGHRDPQVAAYTLTGTSTGVRPQRVDLPRGPEPGVLLR